MRHFEALTSYITKKNAKANKGWYALLQVVISSYCLEIWKVTEENENMVWEEWLHIDVCVLP